MSCQQLNVVSCILWNITLLPITLKLYSVKEMARKSRVFLLKVKTKKIFSTDIHQTTRASFSVPFSGEEALHTFLVFENATEQMCVSWHLELMISQLPERQCILSHQRSMTITFNIIIYTHIIPRDRLSIGCLAAISHPPLIGYHPHFFMFRYVTLRWFAGQNRPSCENSFLSFSECLSQGEILWYCHRHNVLRLKKRGKKVWKWNKVNLIIWLVKQH